MNYWLMLGLLLGLLLAVVSAWVASCKNDALKQQVGV